MKNKVEHVFFDLDHTLWDFDKNSALTFSKIFKKNAIPVPLDSFLEIYEPLNLELWKLYREDKINKETLRYNRLKKTFSRLNFYISDALIHQLSSDYIDHLSTFDNLFHKTIDVLNYLQPKYQLHIITNGFKAVQEKKISNSKIDHYFRTITNSESTGYKKPNPIVFEYALDQAKAKPETSIMIGDSIEADIQGALNIGMQAIWCNFKKTSIFFEGVQIHELIKLKEYL